MKTHSIFLQDVKQAANQVKQELAEARQQLSNKQKECSQFELEVQDLKKEVEEERRKRVKYNQEVCCRFKPRVKTGAIDHDGIRMFARVKLQLLSTFTWLELKSVKRILQE